jgi:hypothetical protein
MYSSYKSFKNSQNEINYRITFRKADPERANRIKQL